MGSLDVTEVLVLTTTVASMPDAQRLAKQLVDRRLAACVQLDPIAASIYRWQGKSCEQPEVRLTVKTLPENIGALEAFIAAHHPYDLPQLTWARRACTPRYGNWVRAEVSAAA